jgi:hypothetical protein
MQEENTSQRTYKKNWKYILLLVIGVLLTIIAAYISIGNLFITILVLIFLIPYFIFLCIILSVIALIVSQIIGGVKKYWLPVFAWLFLIAGLFNLVVRPIKKIIPNPKIDNHKSSYSMNFSGAPIEMEATGPNPPDGGIHEDTWVNLSWTHRESAVSFDVYFSDNFDEVEGRSDAAFQGNHNVPFFVVGFPGFPYPDGLVPGTTYYWRIDEVNDAEPNNPWKGPVWSFSVPHMPDYFRGRGDTESKDTVKEADKNLIRER